MTATPATATDRGSARAVWAWALYDFAASPFTTLVVTFVYANYFMQGIVGDEVRGTVLWSRAIATTGLVVALCSPVLGALADRGGHRKFFLVLATVLCAAATTALYSVTAGQVSFAIALFLIANIAFEMGEVFYNAFLPDIATPDRVGRISGWGWGLGYIGGLLALGVALVALVQPADPWFGFVREGGENYRATNLLVAVWFLVFTVPLILWVREDKSKVSPAGVVVRDTFVQLKRTFVEIRKYRQTVRFLVARLFYNDGLVTIFALGGLYATGTFGFTLDQVIVFGIVINLAAGLGALAMGVLDDWIGGKRTIVVSLIGLFAATGLAAVATSQLAFWIAAVFIGIFAGPNQAASRSLMARFVPHEAENEFFGFFAFSGKLTAFIGPALFGVLTGVTGSQRAGVAVVLGLFALGLVLLLTVDEREGSRARTGG